MHRVLPLCLVAALVACSSTPAAVGADAGVDGSFPMLDGGDDAPAPDDAAPADGAIPDTPLGQRLTWVLAALNGATVTEADVAANFTPAFIEAVPSSDLIDGFAQLSDYASWTLMGFDGEMTQTSLVAVLTRADGQYWRIALSVDAAHGNLIKELLLDQAGDRDPALATFDDVDTAMRAISPNVNLLAADLAEGTCAPIHELNPTSSLALGSAFKLWILATLAQSIAQGQHEWTDTVAIQDRYKSLPSGRLQDQPNGTLLSLRAFAEYMISISDNTAADHLLFSLGRDAVETMLTTTQHHDPAEDQPFLSTRELFDLKLLVSPTDQQAYIAASIAEKRALLATYDETLDPRTYTGGSWDAPILIDKLEWFATPADLCQVMLTLKTYGDQSATRPIRDILSINPGIGDMMGRFAYAGYKGGSEPGVLNMTWLLQRRSDRGWRFFTVGFNDTANPIDDDRALYVAGAARALLAQ
jgi:hypothetical protein